MNMSEILLKITDLHASVGDKEILKGVNLEIGRGEIHAVMGPNGAGKSTLSAVLTGKPDYNVTSGTIEFMGRDLLAMKPEERAWAGIFLSFQYPVEIPGVTITNFMKTAVNSSRKARGLEPLKAPQLSGPCHPRRDRQRTGRGCPQDRSRRSQRPPYSRKVRHSDNTLPETPRLCQARCSPCAQGRQDSGRRRSRADHKD